jgi:hypothetical protein
MNLETFKQVEEKAKTDLSMPDTLEAIIKKNNILPAVIQEWIKLYQDQKYVCASLNVELLELYGDLTKCFKRPRNTVELQKKYNITINEFWETAKEIDSQINCCTPYVAKLKQVNQQKYFLEFIENTLNNIKNLSFAIKNYLDYKKLMMATS